MFQYFPHTVSRFTYLEQGVVTSIGRPFTRVLSARPQHSSVQSLIVSRQTILSVGTYTTVVTDVTVAGLDWDGITPTNSSD